MNAMDFQTLIKTRQSCRKFEQGKNVSEEDVAFCLEAARIAPSACNAQPYKLLVCRGESAKSVADCIHSIGMNKFAEKAPCFIVICENNYNITALAGSKIKNQDYRSIDIGILAAHLTLAATEKGLASCIIGWFDEKGLKKMFDIKGRARLIIALGYCEENYPLRNKIRKSIEEIAEFR